MRFINIAGTRGEELGMPMPKYLDLLESNPFLNVSMPWGELSAVANADRSYSMDGPILWVRPGEQMVPSCYGKNLKEKGRRRLA